MYEYPWQIENAFSKDRQGALTTLSVEAKLKKEDGEINTANKNEIMPLEIHEGFSRFVFTLIKTNGTRKYVYANVPAKDDADEIIERTRIANEILIKTPTQKENAEDSKAYSVRLTSGTYRGKTPAQILIESPEEKEVLLKQARYLNERLLAYPGNKAQIEAIKEAVKLLEEDRLSKENVSHANESIEIYRADLKPLASTMASDGPLKGLVLVYGIKITCIPGNTYPYRVEIENSRAPVRNGLPVMKEAVNREKLEIPLSFRKWNGIVKNMERTLDSFHACCFSFQYKKAAEAENFNRLHP